MSANACGPNQQVLRTSTEFANYGDNVTIDVDIAVVSVTVIFEF